VPANISTLIPKSPLGLVAISTPPNFGGIAVKETDKNPPLEIEKGIQIYTINLKKDYIYGRAIADLQKNKEKMRYHSPFILKNRKRSLAVRLFLCTRLGRSLKSKNFNSEDL
jgi:hypothetical protein